MKNNVAASTVIVLVALAGGGCSSKHGSTPGHASSTAGAPKAPSDLKVMEAAGGAHLTWKDNADDESEFMVERRQGGGSFSALKTLPANRTDYHDATVTAGQSYTYRVMAMGKDGHAQASGYSNEVSFTAPSTGPSTSPDAGMLPDAGGTTETGGATDTRPADAAPAADGRSDAGSGDATKTGDAADARDPHMGHT